MQSSNDSCSPCLNCIGRPTADRTTDFRSGQYVSVEDFLIGYEGAASWCLNRAEYVNARQLTASAFYHVQCFEDFVDASATLQTTPTGFLRLFTEVGSRKRYTRCDGG